MFVKLFGSILDSSIWSTDLATRVVWITMLAMADEFGIVNASVGGLARRAQVSEAECRRALEILSSPDKDDRSGLEHGVRIRPLQGAWELVNYQKYRELRTRKQMVDAARQSRHRKRDTSRPSVTRHDVTVEAEAEAEADAEGEGEVETKVKDKSKALVALARDAAVSTHQGVKANGNGGHPTGSALAVSTIIAGLHDVEAQTARRQTADAFREVKVEIVFSYWAKRLGHERALLDASRRKLLGKRLLENEDDLSELLYAIDGALRDDWTMGRDPKSRRKYDGIETIFRDREQVERFAASCPGYRTATPHAMAVKYAGVPNA